jgi:DNA mismatch repair protein MLH3
VNEVYAQKEKPIPVVPCSDAFISDMRHYELQKQLQYKKGASQATNSSYRFSRDDLKEAIVVNQVDSKFIACLLPSDSVTGDSGCGSGATSQGPSRTLVLVDQHAADERVRVEWLQREICLAYLGNGDETGVERTVLDPPVPILLTRHEKLILQRSDDIRDFLASWGVELAPINDVGEEDSGSDDDSNYSQVTVTRIPEIVSNRVCNIFLLSHNVADGHASCPREMTCRISSRVFWGIGQMTC